MGEKDDNQWDFSTTPQLTSLKLLAPPRSKLG
jgi:hypothetical protein